MNEHERLVKEFLADAEMKNPERYALLKYLYPVKSEGALRQVRRRHERQPRDLEDVSG